MGDIEGTYLDELALLVKKTNIDKLVHAVNPIHQEITSNALSFLKDDVLKKINFGHEIADFPFEKQDDPFYHFDSCEFLGSSDRIKKQYVNTVDLITKRDPKFLEYNKNTAPPLERFEFFREDFNRDNLPDGAFEKFGEILHTVQDFYTHTNWVELEQAGDELEKSGKPRYIPKGKLVNEDVTTNWKVISPGEIIDGTNVKVIEGFSDPGLKRPNNGHIVVIEGENNAGLISGVANPSNNINSYGSCPPEIALGHWDPYFVHLERPVHIDTPQIKYVPVGDPIRVNIGTQKFAFLLKDHAFQEKVPPLAILDRYSPFLRTYHKIETGLNKDDPSKHLHQRAVELAKEQTTHEWCRLVNMVGEKKGSDGVKGVKFLFDHWVKDKNSAMNACGSSPTAKIDQQFQAMDISQQSIIVQQFQTIDISQQSIVVIDGSQSSDTQNRLLTYSWKQIGGEPLNIDQKYSQNSKLVIDLNPLKSKGFTGTLTFSLKVNNGLFDSDPVYVNVLVYNSQSSKTFIVNSDEDTDQLQSGYGCGQGEKCTFPIALRLANDNPGTDTIKFVQTTVLDNCMGYDITDPVKIDAIIDGRPGLEITCKQTTTSFPPYKIGRAS